MIAMIILFSLMILLMMFMIVNVFRLQARLFEIMADEKVHDPDRIGFKMDPVLYPDPVDKFDDEFDED